MQQAHKSVNGNADHEDANSIIACSPNAIAGEANKYNKDNQTGVTRPINCNNTSNNNRNNESIQLNKTARLRQEYITAK